ncbi:MAG: hypothetical protein KF830_12475 [Planctomycetes bacterium]|nr:hypothetical protein [Planctomycetota bacterium]
MISLPALVRLALLLTAAVAVRTQDPARPAAPEFPAAIPVGITHDELGRPIAIGPDWEAEFDHSGARFLPVLGSLSPVLMDLRLRAATVRQGDVELALAEDVPPAVRGPQVCYQRAHGVVERFTARREGLEHSLLLTRAIGGTGDLVVRIELAGEAAPHGKPTAAGTHLFAAGHGGVSYGALTAIDARGERVAGGVRLVPGGLEWTVPGRFADAAAWPILLDPLVGTNFQITTPISGPFAQPHEFDLAADVAFDVSNDNYLVVWQRNYSSGGTAAVSSIRALRRSATGAAIGSVLAVSVVDSSRSPCVAGVNRANRFAIAWIQDFFGTTQVRVRTVAAADGAMSSTLFVNGQTQGDIRSCDIAGESSASPSVDAQAWVVWNSVSQGLRGARIAVPAASNSVSIAGTFTVLPPAPNLLFAVISRAPTGLGHLGITWMVNSGLGVGPSLVRAAVIDRSGTVVQGSTTLFSTPDFAFSPPSIDGGGATSSQFVVAWETFERLLPNVVQTHVRAASLVVGAQPSAGTPVLLHSETNLNGSPTVGWRDGKAYVAHTTTAQTRLELRGIDPLTCASCEAPSIVAQPGTHLVSRPALCMDRTGGSNSASGGLLVWTQLLLGGNIGDPVHGRFLDAFSPLATTTNLGGGCGAGGSTQVGSPPAVGNGGFDVRLLQPGATALLAVLNLTPPQPVALCGACEWLPFVGTVVAPVSLPLTIVPVPIPCAPSLAGTTLDAQWTVWKPGTSPCSLVPDFALSNIVRLALR